MESIERKIENYAVVFNVNLLRATLIEATEFKDLLEETISDNDKDIIVNLAACEHLDSTFLGVLVSSYKRLKTQNRTLVIIEPIEQSSIFLTLNSIGKIFPLYTSVKVALEDIENKKLIEKELSELAEPKTYRNERQSKSAYQTESHPLFESPLAQIQEEVQTIESMNVSEIPEPEMSETVHFSDEVPEYQSEFTLTDSNEKSDSIEVETVEENIFHLDSEESVQETTNSEYSYEEMKENDFAPSTQEVIRHDRHFKTGRVEWEFGFSS
jgi:anti-anti-sigma factor